MMGNDVLAVLVRLLAVGTAGMLLVGSLRAPGRRAVGSEAAYWLWISLPASLAAVFLPRAPACLCTPEALVSPLLMRGIGAPLELAPGIPGSHCAWTVTFLWLAGATGALVYFSCCQRALGKSLGLLQRRPDGSYWGATARQPMLIGAWHPRIVLPRDFETRYSASERAVILAHERTHVERRDAVTNGIALALVCLFWFNPLVYWAWNRFRFDQELACDAAVIRKAKVPRRPYARALVKTQLAAAGAIAFGTRRGHPLIERIALLGRPTPTRTRRFMGYAFALALMFCGTYIVWTARPDLPTATVRSESRIAVGFPSPRAAKESLVTSI